MSQECCSKCHLYHSDFSNVFDYNNKEACWRCSCHHDSRNNKKSKKKRQQNNTRRSNKPQESSLDGDERADGSLDYFNNYHVCNQHEECGNINCPNNKHNNRPKSYRIKKGHQPYVESLKRNQITFQVKLIPCTELLQSFKVRNILTDQIIDNLKKSYSERKDLNHAIVDLMLMYGEKSVYRFSRSLRDGGQIELYELLEREAEKIKEESNWYAESSDNDEVLHDYYENSKEDEKVFERVLERSKSYHGPTSSRITDSWALLLDLDKKERTIQQLEKVVIEKEQRLRELRERLKCRGRQMDEDKKEYTEKINMHLRDNASAEKTIKQLEERITEYDRKLDRLRETALENLKSPASSIASESRMLSRRRKSNSFHGSYPSGSQEGGFKYCYGDVTGKGGSVDAESVSEEDLNEGQVIRKLSLQSPDKLADVVAYLIEGNKRRITYEMEIEVLKEERSQTLEYMRQQLGMQDGQGDFFTIFNAFKERNNNKLQTLQEMQNKVGSVEGKLKETIDDNKQIKSLKRQTTEHLKSSQNQAIKLSLEKQFLKGIIHSLKNQGCKNDKRLFPYLNTVTTRPYVEHEYR